MSNTIWGSLIGVLPGIDWLIDKFVIKKNAAKKIGQIYGVDVKFLEDKKEENNNNIELSQSIEILTGEEKSSVDIKLEMDGEKLTEEDTKTKETYNKKTTAQTGAYIGGGVSIGTVISRTVASAYDISTSIARSTLKFVGSGFLLVGAVTGVVVGGVMTNSFCNKLIDKFENYYKENANKIANSYIQAKQYFISK